MYDQPKIRSTNLNIYNVVQGETIEHKIERIISNKEPIKDGAPIIYTDRKDGVQPQYDIRTDRFEIAVEATTKIAKSYKARREDRINKTSSVKQEEEKDSGAKSTQGEGQKPTVTT